MPRDQLFDEPVERVRKMRARNIAAKQQPAPPPARAHDPHYHWLLPVDAPEKTKEMRRTAYTAAERRLDDLAQQITAAHEAAQAAATSAIERAIACGKLLLKAKGEAPRGEWIPWLKASCPGVGVRQCQKYMALARHVASNTNRDSFSSIREATAEISVPRLPPPNPEEKTEPDEISLVMAFRARPEASHDQLSATLRHRQDATELLDAIRREIERWRKAHPHLPRSWIGEALRVLTEDETEGRGR